MRDRFGVVLIALSSFWLVNNVDRKSNQASRGRLEYNSIALRLERIRDKN